MNWMRRASVPESASAVQKKLLEYLEQEVIHWEYSLARGEVPSLGDINKLARSAKKNLQSVAVK